MLKLDPELEVHVTRPLWKKAVIRILGVFVLHKNVHVAVIITRVKHGYTQL